MKKAISFKSTKEAALYFERVLPFDGLIGSGGSQEARENPTYSDSFPYSDIALGEKVLGSILPENSSDLSFISGILGIQLVILETNRLYNSKEIALKPIDIENILKRLKIDHDIVLNKDDFSGRPDKDTISRISTSADDFVKKFGFGDAPTWGSLSRSSVDTGDNPGFELSISGLNLVEIDKLSWEEVIEFRRDEESFKALRDLRLFFEESFENKSKDYISDKLMQLVEKQEKAARLWKWETAQKTMSVVFSNQSALVSTSAAIATAFGGAPLPIVAAATAAFPLGNALLEFSKTLIEAKKESVDRSTRFLTKLKNIR